MGCRKAKLIGFMRSPAIFVGSGATRCRSRAESRRLSSSFALFRRTTQLPAAADLGEFTRLTCKTADAFRKAPRNVGAQSAPRLTRLWVLEHCVERTRFFDHAFHRHISRPYGAKRRSVSIIENAESTAKWIGGGLGGGLWRRRVPNGCLLLARAGRLNLHDLSRFFTGSFRNHQVAPVQVVLVLNDLPDWADGVDNRCTGGVGLKCLE